MHKIDQQQMNEVNPQDQRMSKVPLVLADSVQPALGSPWPYILLGCVSFGNDEPEWSAEAIVLVIRT
jgi:hypothetical protein